MPKYERSGGIEGASDSKWCKAGKIADESKRVEARITSHHGASRRIKILSYKGAASKRFFTQ